MLDVTVSVKRAKAIAAHFGQWTSRTPNGLVIKDNLKNLLETATRYLPGRSPIVRRNREMTSDSAPE